MKYAIKKNNGVFMNRKNSLVLEVDEMKVIDAPEPGEVLLPLWDFDIRKDKLTIQEGSRVITGAKIFAGIYSTVTGTVKSIEPFLTEDKSIHALRIEVAEEDEIDAEIKDEQDFLEKDPAETLEKLNRANLGLNKDIDSIKTVVVSAVDADPLTAVSQQFLKEEKDLIIKGIELVKYLTSAEKIILAIPRDLAAVTADFKSDFSDVFAVDPVYPNGLPEILMRDISASADLGKSVFIKVEKLVASVTALYEGKPFVHKVVTVVDKNRAENFRVRIGTPIKELLKDNSIEDNFKVIIGGPMRGYTCLNTDLPVTDDMDCIYVQDRDEVVHNSNRQCINCGKCVRVCPVNIDVNLISRFSEFSIFEKCEELEVMNCIECGLCAYYCPAERSLVQYIRLAKKEIKNMEKMEGEEVQ